MIEARELGKIFKTRTQTIHAVDKVSFIARDGVVTGLLGPNGAGKTTTLRMLASLIHPTAGQALVDGIDVSKEPIRARARLGVLSDARGLYARMTARENIRYYGELRGMPRAEIDQRAAELASLLDMHTILDRPTGGFSQGERMKTAIARALIHDPQNVILDEPTNGLDIMTTRAMREVILALKARGKCIIFSSHIMQEVAALCDDIVVISSGRIAARGSAEQIREQSGEITLEEAFVTIIEREATS